MPELLPLTTQQRWLWSLHWEHLGWNCVFTYQSRVSGKLNYEHLRGSLREVLRRHSSLRTRIILSDGIPQQAIEEHDFCPLEIVAVNGTSREETEEQAQHLVDEIARRKKDLAQAPLIKIIALMLADQEHLLVLSFHHLIMDCFSVEMFFSELWSLYGKSLKGEPFTSQAMPPQYKDYTLWQRDSHANWLKAHAAYWDKRLAGATPVRWPMKLPESQVKQGVLGRMRGCLGNQLSAQIRDAAKSARTLSAVAMLTIYVATLFRWCRQIDFVVPFNVSGRQSEHRRIIGYFSHIAYLRIQVTGGETFAELLRYVGDEFFRALLHADFGAQAIEHPRLLSGTFAQWITWNTENTPQAINDIDDLAVEPFTAREFGEGLTAVPPGVVDVEVSFFDTPQGTHVRGVYRADRFTAATMQRFMAELRSAAEHFAADTTACIARTDVLA